MVLSLIDCHQNLARIVLPCARCCHAKEVQDESDHIIVKCDFSEFEGTLEDAIRKSRVCRNYAESLECLSKFISSRTSTCSH